MRRAAKEAGNFRHSDNETGDAPLGGRYCAEIDWADGYGVGGGAGVSFPIGRTSGRESKIKGGTKKYMIIPLLIPQ